MFAIPDLTSKTRKIALIGAISVIVIGIVLVFCLRKNNDRNDLAYAKYIDSYTAGTISRKSNIRIHLVSDAKGMRTLNKPIAKQLFDFSPNVKGKAYWIDAQTIEFRPEEELKAGKKYSATFQLGDVAETEKELERFDFDFKVTDPGVQYADFGLISQNNTSLDYMKLVGEVTMADSEDPAAIQKLLTTDFTTPLNIKWQHHPEKNSSTFTIDSIHKTASAQKLTVKWDGSPINAKEKGGKEYSIPAAPLFEVLDIRAVQGDEDYALIQFSHPISVSQDLSGLISIGTLTDLRFTIDGSQVKVYAPDELLGTFEVTAYKGVENIEGKKLAESKRASVTFEEKLPSVTITGSGTIIPNSGKLVLPFDAINLKAIDIVVIKINENNIPQFFQYNSYKDGNDLRRLAKPILQTTVRLDNNKSLNLHKKNRFSLDLDKLIKTEPGAMYRITIGFRQEYNVYNCAGNAERGSNDDDYYDGEYYDQDDYNAKIDEDDEFWSTYNNYYPENYTWDERNDPCKPSFYTHQKWVSRNLITSNIGLIAKKGNDNSMTIIATDLLTAKPLDNVSIDLLDYQKQLIKNVKTEGDGIVTLESKRTPFLLVARHGKDRGYLKLDDGGALPLSRFDVGGDVIQKGLKGFIYGERGVWRPGDSLYISFILEDKQHKLPDNYPVSFELFNPQGQLSKKLISTKPLNGFYTFKLATDPGAPTGNWLAKVKAGGATFSKNLKIETVMPNRLKIKFDIGGKNYLSSNASAATLSANWLFGAAGKNLKAKVDVNLNTTTTTFKGYENYSFDNPIVNFHSQVKTIFEGTLNQNGTAQVNTDLGDARNAPGVLRANFTTKVFEPGGNFSIDNFSIPYHVYSSYLGISTPEGKNLSGMLYTNTDHNVSVINVNQEGVLLSGSKDVQVELYKVQWRWWWEQDDQYTYTNFTQNKYNKLISTSNIRLINGKGTYKLRVNEPEWGRYMILVRDVNGGGHVSGKSVYIDWPGWAQREQSTNPTEASMLSFTANKKKFNVGEEITLTIPTGENGHAFLSLENGSRIVKTFWIETKKGQTQFKFKAEKEMAPNVFANITLLQPHAQTLNDLPLRMYGVIPLEIEDPQTQLKPVIRLADKLLPETKGTITINEQNGKAMTYTIALVDEGLLDLTRFVTPNPHAAFYAREGLGVKTWDMFDYVLGAWGGNLNRILSIGGDGTINRNVNPAKANRFKPVLKFMGPFNLAKGESKTHTFTLPQYIGSVRAMVVAADNGAYGSAEKTVQVKKPLMVLATVPRVIGPGEQFTVPVSVFATEKNIKNVNLQLEGGNITIDGSKTQMIAFAQTGEEMAYFSVKAPQVSGIAKLKITARSGNQSAVYTVELDVRNPNPFITNVVNATLQPGQTYSTSYKPIGMQGTNSGALEVSSIPPMNLSKRLNYLISYPHGCIEQTVSGAFPQLYLQQLTQLSEQQKTTSERNIRAAINKIKGFQSPEGGLSYWPGVGSPDNWGSNYAAHFLIEAQNAGYSLPPGLFDELMKYQKKQANDWTPNTTNFVGGDLSQAYRLYTLALAKKPEIAAMNRLKVFQYISVAAKWRLAAAYQLAGQTGVAAQLIKGLPTDVKPYNQLGGTYGTEERDQAMIMETLTLMGQKNMAARLLQPLAVKLGSNNWYSTQTTAYSLLAIAKFCGQNKTGTKLQYNYQLDGKSGAANTNAYLQSTQVNFKGNNLKVTNTGSNVLFVRLILAGQPVAGQNEFLPNNKEALTMNVAYKQLNGKEIDPSVLKQGTDFMAEVTIKNPGRMGYYEQMALTQIFPSGWEIINTRLNDNEGMIASSAYTYQDIRDDRVLTYFNIRENETLTYRVLLNASYLGKFYLSAVQCEAMYNNNITATQPGKWVQVIK